MGELEVTEVGSGLISIEAGQRGERVVIEQTGNVAVRSRRIGISDHVQQQPGWCGRGRFARVFFSCSISSLSHLARAVSRPRPVPDRATAARTASHRRDEAPSPLPDTRICTDCSIPHTRSCRHTEWGAASVPHTTFSWPMPAVRFTRSVAQVHPPRDFLDRGPHVQHILRRIVMHLADFVDVIVQGRHFGLLLRQHGAGFFERPGEVIAVVVHGDVGILRREEAAALAIAEPLVHPANDVAGHAGEEFLAGGLIAVHVILQQFGIVVAHLLEVRHHPALVHRIAVKPTRQLVVHAAVSHVLKRGDDEVAQLTVGVGRVHVGTAALGRPAERSSAGSRIPLNQQIQRRRMRKLRRLPESSMLRIKHPERRSLDRGDHAAETRPSFPAKDSDCAIALSTILACSITSPCFSA